jgi:hypothetical protein
MNRIIITEGQLYNLICEAATLDDIYVKYYSNIDREIFNKIVSSDPTWREDKPDKMGKFGKWLLKLWVNKKLMLEDLYKATEYLSYFVKYNNRIEVKDINKYRSLPELYNIVKVYMDNPEIATSNSDEVRRAKEGAEKVYEDSEWLIVVPHTKEASCYYGKGTQWCTAAENSHNMFDDYNKKGNLYINIRKSDGEKFQFHFETESFMDATDTSIDTPIFSTIGFTDNVLNFYKERVGEKYYRELVEIREEVYYTDSGYMLILHYNTFNNICYFSDTYGEEFLFDQLILPKGGVEEIIKSIEDNDYVVLNNKYGYKSMIALTDNEYFEKIDDYYLDVKPFCSNYSVKPRLVYTIDKDENMELYDFKNGYTLYREYENNIIKYGEMGYGSVVYFKLKGGTYDLLDYDSGEILNDLRPINESSPFNDDSKFIYMYNSDGNLMKIDLDYLSYSEEVYDEEEMY